MFIFRLISSIIGHINQKIAVIGISAGVAVAFTNVVARYVFDASFTWAAELTIYLFLWSVFFGAAYCFKKDAHIAVTILVEVVPSWIAKIMMIISHTVSLVFLSAVAYYGIDYINLLIMIDERSIDLWNMPTAFIYVVVPISLFFAAYRVLERLIEIIKTPHEKIVRESETDALLKSIKGTKSNLETDLDHIVKEAEKKTGGML